ncbi:MAG: cytochrome c biogenesis protein [Candidatus Methanofastidiosia archaeon]
MKNRILKAMVFLWICAVIVFSFIFLSPVKDLGETARIIVFHVPTAWIASLAFFVGTYHSIMYLRTKKLSHDLRALSSEELGFFFCILATLTGSIFAKAVWHSFWNWDPRETSIFVLLLIYGAYFALRGATEGERRRTLASVYATLAFVSVPFLVFAVPRITYSLHPDIKLGFGEVDIFYRSALFASVFGFSAIYLWLYRLRVSIEERRPQNE